MFKLRISYFTSSVNGNNKMPQTHGLTIGFGATEFQFMMIDGLVARSADSAKLGSLQFNPTYINIHYTETPVS